MSFTLDAPFVELPGSGSNVYLAKLGAALDVYRVATLAKDANYLIAARSVQVLASGCDGTDPGSGFVTNPGSCNVGIDALRQRGRCIVWPPHFNVDLRMKFHANGTGHVDLYASASPLLTDISAASLLTIAPYKSGTAAISAGFDEYTIDVDDCPVAKDGMIYLYVALHAVSEVGAWCIYRRPITL